MQGYLTSPCFSEKHNNVLFSNNIIVYIYKHNNLIVTIITP